jgi:hypothetical protein
VTALAEETGLVISEPGVYPEIPDTDYHRDPVPEHSLSCSGAKRLLPPSCPALFKYEQEHGRPGKRTFDFGHAAHKLVLGVGPDLVSVDAENWRTNAAKDAANEARARGAVPILAHEMAEVEAMAAALREHPVASRLLINGGGTPEASLFWRDEPTKVMRRARLDMLPPATSGRMIVPDYKSAVSAAPTKFGNSAADYGYHMQASTYIEAVTTLGLAEDVAFVFVVQEKTAPYLVSVVELDSLALRIGRHQNRKAVDLYLDCQTKDEWPAWSNDVELVSLPRWAEITYEQETA